MTLSVVVTFPFKSITDIAAPIISDKYENENNIEISSLYWKVTNWIIMVSLPIMITIGIFSKEFIGLVYGSEFISGALVLTILTISQGLRGFVGPSGITVQMTGYEDWNLYLNSLSSFLNIGLNLILIPNFGLFGAAIASSVSIISTNISHLLLLFWKGHLDLIKNLGQLKLEEIISTNLLIFIMILGIDSVFSSKILVALLVGLIVVFYSILIYLWILDANEKKTIWSIIDDIAEKVYY
jgi:O-antigen/teichoic acid export membrane protein